ncbi:class I SAM-dependent methyltransferase [Halarcobacter ebronensis]|uniref:Histidine kinase n=1 Tax=Halarcobacter ebronensis TaxID=1462615 RepID=A0A4Q1AMC7_9BACT|nr:methyltransferase domain-containing protein [Halarcobacter ebronensis]QKF82945.1 SAM-dependent methyltransferase [Halarcobacter ebronensis]RXK02857.1 histidine kinase [Halarcobacter ebronensis]
MSNIRVKYNTYEFDKIDIHLKTLRDKQEYDNEKEQELNEYGISSATWSLFGVVWPASEVLAKYIKDYDVRGKRVLEIGCGIALSSHLLNSKNVDITATDYHPEVESFLNYNSALNNLKNIPFERTSWSDEDDTLGKFDLIIGSDILYERWHIEELSSFVSKHAKKKCEIIISDPGRGNHAKFSKIMVTLGFSFMQFKPKKTDEYLTKAFKGQLIKYTRE